MDAELLNRAAPPASLRYFATLYAPAPMRECVYAAYAIEAEVRDSANSANHDVAHTRLRWWREEIERLTQGNPQHPATQTLASLEPRRDWSSIQQLLFAAEIELSRMTFDTDTELTAYLERSGGTVQQIVAEVVQTDGLSEALRARARRLGAIARHAEVLRSLRNEARSGRIYLPLRKLDAVQVPHAELSADEPSQALRDLVASEAERSLRAYREQQSSLTPHERAQLRPVLVFAALHAKLLERLARGQYRPHPPLELGAFERAWIAWRTAIR